MIYRQKNAKQSAHGLEFPLVSYLVSNMEDLCKRIPLVAGMILKKLDNQSLMICKESSRVLWQYLDEEKLVSIQIIKEYKKFFAQFQNVWEKVLKKASVEIVQEFAILVQEFFKPSLPTADINDYRNRRRQDQWHPLWMAILCNQLQLCKYIIEKTGDTNPVRYDGINPLHFAAEAGHSDIYEFLMINFSNKNPALSNGWTPLHYAALCGHLEVFKLIIKEVTDKNPRLFQGFTPLHVAAKKGHLDICKLIIEEGVEANPTADNGCTHTSTFGYTRRTFGYL